MKSSRQIVENTLAEVRSEQQEDPVRQLCHEISGPLTSILVHCDLLLENASAPEARQRLVAIQGEALRISRSLRAASQS